MTSLPPLRQRIVRVVIRMGGTAADAACAIGCSKHTARRIAGSIGCRFGSRTGLGIGRLTEPEPHP